MDPFDSPLIINLLNYFKAPVPAVPMSSNPIVRVMAGFVNMVASDFKLSYRCDAFADSVLGYTSMLLGIWLMIYGCRKFKFCVAVVIMMVVIFITRLDKDSKQFSDIDILVSYIDSIVKGAVLATAADICWTGVLLFIGGLSGLGLCELIGAFLPLPANFINTVVEKGIATSSFVIGAFVVYRMERYWLALLTSFIGSILLLQGIVHHFGGMNINVFRSLAERPCPTAECQMTRDITLALTVIFAFVQYRFTGGFVKTQRPVLVAESLKGD